MPSEQKQTQNPKNVIFKTFLCLKTKTKTITEMTKKTSDSEFYYAEEQETAEES